MDAKAKPAAPNVHHRSDVWSHMRNETIARAR